MKRKSESAKIYIPSTFCRAVMFPYTVLPDKTHIQQMFVADLIVLR